MPNDVKNIKKLQKRFSKIELLVINKQRLHLNYGRLDRVRCA